MFTIDLLNGTALPSRSRPLRAAAIALAFLALAVGAAFDGAHVHALADRLAAQQQSLGRLDRRIADLADVAQKLETAEKQRSEIAATLAEANQFAGTHMPWSPLLATVAAQTPKGLTISEILAKREERKNAKGKGLYDFSLVLGVISPGGAAPVERFLEALRTALPLQPGPDGVRIISQRHLEVESMDMQYYIVECKLKP